MCEDCRTHGIDCNRKMIQDARPDQIRRLILDILLSSRKPGGSAA